MNASYAPLIHELVSLEKHSLTHTNASYTPLLHMCIDWTEGAGRENRGVGHEDALWRHITEPSARARARVVRVARAMWPEPRAKYCAGRVMCGWVMAHTDMSAMELVSPHARDKLGGAHRSLIDIR